MPQYVIHVSDGSQQDRTIEAKDEREAIRVALAALSVHISSKFPPPDNVEIIIKDEDLTARARLRFGYEVPEGAGRTRWLQ